MNNSSKTIKGPVFIQYFDPIMRALTELGGSGQRAEIADKIIEERTPNTAESQLLPSGMRRIEKNLDWAKFYLSKYGYIDSSTRGV
jgi:restriction system protein